MAAPVAKRGIQIVTKAGAIVRDEWLHVFFTYDGSRKASGVKIYLNGKLAETDASLRDTVKADDVIFVREALF